MKFNQFFKAATKTERSIGNDPYAYQVELAGSDGGCECKSKLINIPTGLGKTAAVVLAWLWNRVILDRPDWPRRLVYCLPMRTLVEQTSGEIEKWLRNTRDAALKGDIELPPERLENLLWLAGTEGVSPHSPVVLMGGEENDLEKREWDIYLERPAVLIGTQDMLLSRALNRGYGMSRYRWPMHFGLLNNDCLWVMDETQLMGPGLWTSGQLDWMRQYRFGVIRPCFTWWMSATNCPEFLDTPDRREDKIVNLPKVEVGDDQAALSRINPKRPLCFWDGSSHKQKGKKKGASATDYVEKLATAIQREHTPGTLSLVVCNTVKAAQELYGKLNSEHAILLTSRFRREDRKERTAQLLHFEARRKAAAASASGDDTLPNSPGLICISTQVIEAGLDISARRLWTEAAPWASTLQRLGRLNRDGFANGKAKAFVFSWPEEGKKSDKVGPYEAKEIAASLELLEKLAAIYETEPALGAKDAMDKLCTCCRSEIETSLIPKDEPFPRAIDVHGLFSTEPDVFGGFTDVSQWVRGTDRDADVTVFWREFDEKKGPGGSESLDGPAFDLKEGCAVAIHRFREFLDKGRAFVWDERVERWQSLRASELCPGMVVMLPRSAGGYSEKLGWTGRDNDRLEVADSPGRFSDSYEDETASQQLGWVTLGDHLADAKLAAQHLAEALQLRAACRAALVAAAELHDIGKAHPVWQNALPENKNPKEVWAKAPRVFALSGDQSADFRESTERLLDSECIRAAFFEKKIKNGDKTQIPSQTWTVSNTISKQLFDKIISQGPGLKASMLRFLPRPNKNAPCIRHEAASALAAWNRYFKSDADWPGLALYLIASHHGKVRTVLYARGEDGEDVCGVPNDLCQSLPWAGGMLMDFSCAMAGSSGEFSSDGLAFFPTSPGWTALVADLLGGWEKRCKEAPPPLALRDTTEPRILGPFALAYFESLICSADTRASKNPTGWRHV